MLRPYILFSEILFLMRSFLTISSIILLLLVIILSIALGWLVFTRQPYVEPFRPDSPEYGQRGDYTVGVQSFTISGENRPLNAWVWYPTTGEQELANYSEFNGIFETSGRANWDAPPANNNAPYPLVIFSHGSGSSPLLSLFFTEHLASHGFVVIGMEHPGNTMLDRLGSDDAYNANIIENYVHRPNDVSRTIDYALDELNTGALSGIIDPDKIAVSGHSFGGYTAFASAGASLNFDALQTWCDENEEVAISDFRDEVALTAYNQDFVLGGVCYLIEDAPRIAELSGYDDVPSGVWDSFGDERINAVIGLASYNAPIFGEESIAELQLPALILVGGNDNVTFPERDARNFYGWLGSENKYIAEFALADHYIFNDNCSPLLINFGAYYSCSDSVWDLNRAHDLINHFATAFLLSSYYNDTEATVALEREDANFVGVRMQRP